MEINKFFHSSKYIFIITFINFLLVMIYIFIN